MSLYFGLLQDRKTEGQNYGFLTFKKYTRKACDLQISTWEGSEWGGGVWKSQLFRFLGQKTPDENTHLLGSSFAISEPHKLNIFRILRNVFCFCMLKHLAKLVPKFWLLSWGGGGGGGHLFEVLEFSRMWQNSVFTGTSRIQPQGLSQENLFFVLKSNEKRQRHPKQGHLL